MGRGPRARGRRETRRRSSGGRSSRGTTRQPSPGTAVVTGRGRRPHQSPQTARRGHRTGTGNGGGVGGGFARRELALLRRRERPRRAVEDAQHAQRAALRADHRAGEEPAARRVPLQEWCADPERRWAPAPLSPGRKRLLVARRPAPRERPCPRARRTSRPGWRPTRAC